MDKSKYERSLSLFLLWHLFFVTAGISAFSCLAKSNEHTLDLLVDSTKMQELLRTNSLNSAHIMTIPSLHTEQNPSCGCSQKTLHHTHISNIVLSLNITMQGSNEQKCHIFVHISVFTIICKCAYNKIKFKEKRNINI